MQTNKISELFGVGGKVALVTGGSRGIGYMIAKAYVDNGARVYITSRKAKDCHQAAEELSKAGVCYAIPADIASEEGRNTLIGQLMEKEQSLDILVNNAGASWGAAFEDYPEAAYDKVMDINVKAVFVLTQKLLPLLQKNAGMRNPSRVINIGSIDGIRVSRSDNFAYGPSKAAVHIMTQYLAKNIADRGITVNAIAPGYFESKMTQWVLDNFQTDIEADCPLGRIGNPSDMAGVAIFLASPASSYINGAIITVDGGLSL